ncbi:hypothetical protein WK24_13760 [Burkholderia vietnamiensis]|nr:hypothetical protein WK24_13760 [Burkholderia vietnamiensis]
MRHKPITARAIADNDVMFIVALFSFALLKRFVEPRTSFDFVGGQLPHALAVDPPIGSVRETCSKHTITP